MGPDRPWPAPTARAARGRLAARRGDKVRDGGMNWLKFLRPVFGRAWRHTLGVNVAGGRCIFAIAVAARSPVCSRRDVTPHHLQFRSAGGGDEDDNMASLCTCCHLFSAHGGKIRAQSRFFWELLPGSGVEPSTATGRAQGAGRAGPVFPRSRFVLVRSGACEDARMFRVWYSATAGRASARSCGASGDGTSAHRART